MSHAQTDPAATDLLRRVFRRHAAGVAVVTVGGETPTGFTATSVASLSADPPLLTFNVASSASAWPALERAEHVAVHLLAHDQEALSTTFATPGIDRLAAVPGRREGPHGLPILPDVAAWAAGRVHLRVNVADRVIVVAEIGHAEVGDALPLLYHDGTYRRLA